MRHGSRFLRWRFDKKPKACTMDQLKAPRRSAA
jgi:ATP-dependent DNA ligase